MCIRDRYIESAKLIESSKLYDPDEAVKLALQTAKTKFDETMEISVRLGVDPRQADQQVLSLIHIFAKRKERRFLCRKR